MATNNANVDPKGLTLNTTMGVVALAEVGLALRVLFQLFGADGGQTGFVSWLYETTGVLLEPLRNVFRPEAFSTQNVLDFTALFAMVVYMVFGLAVNHVVNTVKVK